ncbi:lipopolysaccharide biosynthesis protein [Micropruina sp.]|uniref:lipopolysaccharide biosynthesis protein n=1 Tax=Micropruina sp. TaxID=2737536 RepID=UPI0039E2A6AB
MSGDALKRGARGGSTVILGQILRIGIQLTGTVALARLLSPADFGLVAMVMVFTSFGALLRDFGISTAALQARTLTHQQASNLFWFSTSLSAAVAILLVASTPLLIGLYAEPRLSAVAPALAVGLLLDGVQSQVQVQLARSMRYLALTLTDLVAQAFALAVAVLTALAGWGYWALVAQVLTASVSTLASRTAVSRWLPTLPRRRQGSGELVRAGSEFGLAQILTFAASNVDSLMIGARWGAIELGLYNRAFQIYQLPRVGILDPLTQVAIPTVNSATENGAHRATDLLLRIQFLISFLVTWMYLVAAATADWLIPLALGGQWGRSVVLFQLLAIAGVFAAFGTVSYWTFIVSQQSRQLLYLHLVTKPLAVALILVATPLGVEAVALAFAAGLAIAWPINLTWLARTVRQDSWAFFRMGMRVISAAAVAFSLTRWILGLLPALSAWAIIPIGTAIATLFYVLAILVVPGGLRQLAQAARNARTILGRR